MRKQTSALRIVPLLLFAACGLGDTPFEQIDPATVPDRPTWTEHIQPRMDFYCGSCHSPDSSVGLSSGYDFSSYNTVSGLFSEIERVAVFERSMPPGAAPRINASDWAILKRWAAKGFPK